MAARRRRARKRPEPLTASGIVAINLRKARELRGLSQAEAGERLGRHLRQPWSAPTVSAAERCWEVPPQRSFTAHELDAFSRVFKLPVLWFLLPPAPEDCGGRALPPGWVRRLLWSDASELEGRAEALVMGRRGAGLPEALKTAENAVALALEGHRKDRLRTLARQLREVAGTLEAAGRRRPTDTFS